VTGILTGFPGVNQMFNGYGICQCAFKYGYFLQKQQQCNESFGVAGDDLAGFPNGRPSG